jgi:hypothetical protein
MLLERRVLLSQQEEVGLPLIGIQRVHSMTKGVGVTVGENHTNSSHDSWTTNFAEKGFTLFSIFKIRFQ